MLDVGWTEILVIAIVLIIVVGPKDLPQMLRTFGRMMTKMRGMAGDFRQQFDEALREADLEDVKKTIGDAQRLNPLNSIREAVNPLRQMGNDIKADLEKTTSSISSAGVPANSSGSVSSAPAAVPSEAEKPASAEPVAAVPLKAGPTRKTVTRKSSDAAAPTAKLRKAPVRTDAEAKATAGAATAKKVAPAKSRTAKTKKDQA